ncbi:MAG TPA: hypothetical protein VGI74_06685 [Streptosporangiaceae bacterium]
MGALTLTAVLLPTAVASAAAGGVFTPVSGVNSLDSITCPTAKTCVAVGLGGSSGSTGKSVIVAAATGKATTWSGGLTNDPLNAVACHTAATTCLSVADDAVATVAVSTGAMKVTAVPKPPAGGIMALGTIACATAKSCYAAGFQGIRPTTHAVLLHLSGAGKIIKKTVVTGTGIAAIACPASTGCLFTDSKSPVESLQMVSNGHISTVATFPADTFVQSIKCFQASLCYALGGNGTSNPELTNELFPLNPTTGAIGSVIKLSGGGFSGTGLACASATKCLVAGFNGSGANAKPAVVTVTSGKPGSPVNFPGEVFSAVGCATASLCYATGLASTGAIIEKV